MKPDWKSATDYITGEPCAWKAVWNDKVFVAVLLSDKHGYCAYAYHKTPDNKGVYRLGSKVLPTLDAAQAHCELYLNEVFPLS